MDAVSTRPRPPARRGTNQRASVPLDTDRTATTAPSSTTSALTALPSTPRTLQRRSRGGRISLGDGSGRKTAALADQGAGLDLEPGTISSQLPPQHAGTLVGGLDKVDNNTSLGEPGVTPLRHDRDVAQRRRSLNRPDEDGVRRTAAGETSSTQRHIDYDRVDATAAALVHTAEPEEVHDVAPSAGTARSPPLAHATLGPLIGTTPCDDFPAPLDGTATAYERLSRADLERRLGEADKIIREKEQELTVFTTAGQGLLDEYNALKQRHDSLRRKIPADLQSPAGSPVKQRQLGSGGLTSRRDDSPSRARNESLRFRAGFAGASTRPSEQSRPQSQADPWLTPTSTVRHDLRTPSGSPTSSRDVIKSGSLSASSKSGSAPSSRFLFSPSAAQADEAAALTQANYALTLQLNEVQADSEAAEREGRKRLRRLERELQSLRADLERVEQRNAILESQAEGVKEKENELAKSARAIRVAPRKIFQPVTPNRRSYGPSPARTAAAAPGQQESPSRTRSSGVPHGHELDTSLGPFEGSKDPALLHAFPTFSALYADPALPVVPARSVYRTVSTSSLVPLPPPVRIDPSLEQQQDELVDQLIAKIDELQDTNYGFLSERETMFNRLAEAQEEMYDWKERYEELEDENQQHRLIGWRDAVQNADGLSSFEQGGTLLAGSRASPPPPLDRPHFRRPIHHRLADSNSVSLPSSLDISDAVRSLSTVGEMSPPLGKELGDCAPAAPSHTLPGLYDTERGQETEGSVVLCGGDNLTDLPLDLELHLDDRRQSLVKGDEAAVTTSDDLLFSGGLRWAGQPDADKYQALEEATAELAPDWQDQPRPSRAVRLSRLRLVKERLESSAVTLQHADRSMAQTSQEARCDSHGRRNGDRSRQFVPGMQQHKTRRRRALRRLSFEAELRRTAGMIIPAGHVDSDAESTMSSAWSEFDNVEQSLVHRSDYYPTARTARFQPTALAGMVSDSAAQHVVTFFTWIRFMAILTTAIIFAVWQGPRKTLSLVDGHRRRLK